MVILPAFIWGLGNGNQKLRALCGHPPYFIFPPTPAHGLRTLTHSTCFLLFRIKVYHGPLIAYYSCAIELSPLWLVTSRICGFPSILSQTSKLVDDILGELQSIKKKVKSFEDLKTKVEFRDLLIVYICTFSIQTSTCTNTHVSHACVHM